ncbi:MAG: hypothetical protein V7761_02740 [Amylibacter sp.]
MRLNDKALTFITGVVLLLGVGTFVHKGDELFAPKTSTTQIAKVDMSSTIRIDAAPHSNENIPAQRPDDFVPVAARPAKPSPISGFELVRSVQTASASTSPETLGTLKIDPGQMDCSISLSAKSLRGARIQLVVKAPCHRNKVITIAHAGLRFNEIVDNKGEITITIPVLSDPANIEVSFADGTSKSISTPVKDLSSLQRTGIAWSGRANLQLNADERFFDSSHNEQITKLNTRSYKRSYLQGGGYLTMLGNSDVENGKFIQIYSVENPNDVFIDFMVVLENPKHLCGTGFSINTMRYAANLGTQIASKNVSVKNCSADNQSIVLKNILRSLIVAQRN